MVMDRAGLAQKLRQARENCGISQKAAADHVGLSRTVIAQIELGNRPVGTDELSKLAGLYPRAGGEVLGGLAPSREPGLAPNLTVAPGTGKGSRKVPPPMILILWR